MKIGNPVIKGLPQIVAAEHQPQYLPLPLIRQKEGIETTRYHLSFRERVRVLFVGDIYLQLLTSETFTHPRKLMVKPPIIDPGSVA